MNLTLLNKILKKYIRKEEVEDLLNKDNKLEKLAIENVDLRNLEEKLQRAEILNCYFLGCDISQSVTKELIDSNNYVLPKLDLPYSIFKDELYNRESLINGFDPSDVDSYQNTDDYKIYHHYLKYGKKTDFIYEGFARNLHDHSLEVTMNKYLKSFDQKKIIGIMGGHSISRRDPEFYKVCLISKSLTEKGFLMVSGGGPGMMEATHIGAWFAGRSIEELKDAVEYLKSATHYTDPNWLKTAFDIIDKYPQINGYQSLGIPTWVYGHEPPNPFPTKIAKYFSVSVRQEGLLSIATGGIIYTPGSAGTLREIFQDAEQNHYLSYGVSNPMVFFGNKYWSEDVPIHTLLDNLSKKGFYKNLQLYINDNPEDVIDYFIKKSNE